MSQIFTAYERKEWPVLGLLEGDLKSIEEITTQDLSMPVNRMSDAGDGMVTSGMWPHMTDLVLHALMLRYDLTSSWTPAVGSLDSVLIALRTVMRGKFIDPFLAEAVREGAEHSARVLTEKLVPEGFSLELGSEIHDLDLVEDEVFEPLPVAPRPARVEPTRPEKLKAEEHMIFKADGEDVKAYLPTLIGMIRLAWSYGLHNFGRELRANVAEIRHAIARDPRHLTTRDIGLLYDSMAIAYDYLNQNAVPEGFQLRYEVGYLDLVPSPMEYPEFRVLLYRSEYVSEEEFALAIIEWARLHGIKVSGVWRKRLWRMEYQKQEEWKKFPAEAIITEADRILDVLNSSPYRRSKSHVFEIIADGSFVLRKRWPKAGS